MKGDIEKQINSRTPEARGKCCHFCKLSQVQCTSVPLAKWKEYHFLNIGAILMEIIPLENHTHGSIPFLIFCK